MQVSVPRYVVHIHPRVWVRANASSTGWKVKPPFDEPSSDGCRTPTRKGNSSSLRSPSLPRPTNFEPSPAETTHSPSLQPRTMPDSTHTPLIPTETFQPRATLRYTSAVGIQAAGVGALVSAVQNALSSHNYGAAGVLTRTGGTIGFFGTSRPPFSSHTKSRIHPWAERNWNHPVGRVRNS